MVGQIQIRQTQGLIGIKTEPGQFEIQQSPASLSIETVNTRLEIHSQPPTIQYDQSKMWDALNGGKPMSFWNRIYNQQGQFVEQAISRINSNYERIGNILHSGNAIADIAAENIAIELPLQVYGPASSDNIDFDVTVQKPEIQVTPGHVNIQVSSNHPEIQYKRGNVSVYMQQFPNLQITSPVIDAIV